MSTSPIGPLREPRDLRAFHGQGLTLIKYRPTEWVTMKLFHAGVRWEGGEV